MTTHALYRFFDSAGDLLYVGITMNPSERWHAHRDDKPWWHHVAQITIETHPDRNAVLLAEAAAIRAERPRHNIVHNRLKLDPTASAGKRWTVDPKRGHRGTVQRVGNRWMVETKHGHRRQCDLYLQPELSCSPMVDDFYHLDGRGQLAQYIRYMERNHPTWLAADAVPIYWSVISDPWGICETAPGQRDWREDFLTFYEWPVDAAAGGALDWYALPVVNTRFPQFAKALAWTPAPLQPTCPLASILRDRTGGTYLSDPKEHLNA